MSPIPEKQILNFLHGLYAPRGGHQLIEFILQHIPGIIACHNRGIARYDPARRAILQMNLQIPFTSRAFIDAVRAGGDMAPESFWRMQPEARHPIHTLSESYTRSQWEEHPMYREMFRSEGLVDCMTLEFGETDRRYMLCLHRDLRGFKPVETAIMRILAPHLDQAFANARLFDHAIPGWTSTARDEGSRIHHLGQSADESVKHLIRRNLPRWYNIIGHKPAAEIQKLHAWITLGRHHLDCGVLDSALTPFTIRGAIANIRLILIRNWGGDGHLLIEESILSWNPTPREQEILHWVRLGKTDREIAIILGLTHHTIREHLRRIYRKTGTNSRTAAARLVPHLGDTGLSENQTLS